MAVHRVEYILPAMLVGDPVVVGPATFCTSAHLSQYSIHPPEHAKSVQLIAASCRPACGRGAGRVGLMLVSAADQAALERDGVPRMCRDALALSYITRGLALCCHHGQATAVYNADYFDALPICLRGDGFIIQRPGFLAFTYQVADYQPTLPIYLSEQRDGDLPVGATRRRFPPR